jgi:hypothetical protein
LWGKHTSPALDETYAMLKNCSIHHEVHAFDVTETGKIAVKAINHYGEGVEGFRGRKS